MLPILEINRLVMRKLIAIYQVRDADLQQVRLQKGPHQKYIIEVPEAAAITLHHLEKNHMLVDRYAIRSSA